MHPSMKTDGQRAIVSALGETPLDAIEQHLTLEKMSPPETSKLAAHEVVIAVKSAAIGWVDVIMTSGQYQHVPKPPYTPGLEYAGEVAWAGPEVKHVKEGDRVIVDGFVAGPRSLGEYQ